MEKEKEPQKQFNKDKKTEARYLEHWTKFLDYQIIRNQTVRFLNK